MPTIRATFLSGDEVISKIRSVLKTAGLHLADLRDAERDPGRRRILERVDEERRLILDVTLADYEAAAPRSVLNRISQYTVEVPGSLLEPPSPDPSGAEIISWIVRVIDRLGAIFEQHATHSDSAEAIETFARLAERFRAHGRKISRTASDAFDIGLDDPADAPSGTTSGISLALVLSVCGVLVALALGCGDSGDEVPKPRLGGYDAGKPALHARAEIRAASGSEVRGTVDFDWNGEETRLVADLRNVPPGTHAFHVHEFGDCSAADASSAGAHFAFYDSAEPAERILGNLGEFEVGDDGVVHLERVVPEARLVGPRSIFEKAVVIHEKGNDPDVLPGGAAGTRIACGVIERVD